MWYSLLHLQLGLMIRERKEKKRKEKKRKEKDSQRNDLKFDTVAGFKGKYVVRIQFVSRPAAGFSLGGHLWYRASQLRRVLKCRLPCLVAPERKKGKSQRYLQAVQMILRHLLKRLPFRYWPKFRTLQGDLGHKEETTTVPEI